MKLFIKKGLISFVYCLIVIKICSFIKNYDLISFFYKLPINLMSQEVQ